MLFGLGRVDHVGVIGRLRAGRADLLDDRLRQRVEDLINARAVLRRALERLDTAQLPRKLLDGLVLDRRVLRKVRLVPNQDNDGRVVLRPVADLREPRADLRVSRRTPRTLSNDVLSETS